MRVRVALGQGMLPVGLLEFSVSDDRTRQTSAFHYDRSWLERPGAFALAPDLPLVEGPQVRTGRHGATRAALPGPLSDATPDSWGRGLIERSLGRRPTELEILLSARDETRQGALRFLDEAGRPVPAPDRRPVPRREDLPRLQALVKTYETDAAICAQRVRELARHAGSLGGARPKVDFDDDGLPALAKFTSDFDVRPVERLEVAALNLARAAGLNAAQARLTPGEGPPVAIIRRFDRRGPGRIPYLSAQTFLGRAEGRAGYYTDILDGMAAHGTDPARQMAELHARLLFTILVSNADDHLRNHGFLYAADGRWTLAPAFDIVPQPERPGTLETGIGEEYGHAASIQAAVEAAPWFGRTKDQARATLARIIEVVEQQWAARCRDAGMTADEVAACRPAFEHEETAAARRLAAVAVQAAVPMAVGAAAEEEGRAGL